MRVINIADRHQVHRFGGNSFDGHTEVWVTLYDYTLGSHRMTLKTSQLLLPSGLVAMDNGVRANYNGTASLFQNGEVPVPDIYYEHPELDKKLVFPDLYIKVVIQGGHARSPINYFYNVWITTYAAIGCTGLCCDVEVDIPIESLREMQSDLEDPEDKEESEDK